MISFEGKIAVITGARGALGERLSARFETLGATVIRLDIRSDEEDQKSFAVDLTDSDATQQVFRQIGAFDVLVNTAGGFAMGQESWDDDSEQWGLMQKLNVTTLRNAIKSAVPLLLTHGGGSIVNVGAYGALEGQAAMGAYIASKSVVMRLTETLAEELRSKGINVNAVLPTIIDTPDNRAAMPKAKFEKWVSPDDLADAICFLASPAAKAVHGALLPVRGLS